MGLVREYFDNTQFHGFRFLTQPDRHWIERFYWVICICGSWFACFIIISYSYDSYQNNALSFGTDTDYIDWNTSFFSIAVCESKNKAGVYAVGEKLWGKEHDYNLDEVLNEISYFKGDHYFTRVFCSNGPRALPCPKNDFKNLSDMVRGNCQELFEDCMWQENFFTCCKHFFPIETERGLCFIMNSLNTPQEGRSPLYSNKMSGPGYMNVMIKVPAEVYILTPEDVPSMNTPSSNVVVSLPGLYKKHTYTITEITNGDLVSDVDVNIRLCKFPWEKENDYYPVYSRSSCLVACRARKQLEICNCVSHLNPGSKPSQHCNISGLNCLIDNYLNYSVLAGPGSDKGLSCNCLPSCLEPELELILQEEYGIGGLSGKVEISLQQLPTMRLRRTVVRGPLDLVVFLMASANLIWNRPRGKMASPLGLLLTIYSRVSSAKTENLMADGITNCANQNNVIHTFSVSIGGSFGLFVGASLLSFVELIYYCTIRVFWHYKAKRDAKKQLLTSSWNLILEFDIYGNPIEKVQPFHN